MLRLALQSLLARRLTAGLTLLSVAISVMLLLVCSEALPSVLLLV